MIGGSFLKEPLPVIDAEQVRDLVENRGLSYGDAAFELGTTRNAIAGVVARSKSTGAPIRSTSERARQIEANKQDPKRKVPRHVARKKHPDNRPGDSAVARNIVKRVKARRKTGFNVLPALIDPAIADTRPPLADAWAALPGTAPVGLEQVSGCRWPIGDAPPFTFCNDAPAEGSAYCPAHTTMGIRPLTRDERRLAKAPKAVL